nr:hypothetical protein [uncultured Dyadobacter sp.]
MVQYLENAHDSLEKIKNYDFKHILIDRTAFIQTDRPDRLTLQLVPPEICEAHYPAWFFNERRFLKHFEGCDIKMEFESFVEGEQEIEIDHVKSGYDKGFS